MLYHLLAGGYRVTALTFDYGQKHRYELECATAQLGYLADHGHQIHHVAVDISTLGRSLGSALTDERIAIPLGHYQSESMKQTVVPNRNAIFFSMAAAQALSIANQVRQQVKLSLAVHSGDHEIYPDCRPEFYDAVWHAFQLGNWNAEQVEMYLPYLHLDKAAILRDAERSITALNLDFDTIFRNTCTSYMPDAEGRGHGLTGSDHERILAFHALGRVDPVPYQQPWDDLLARALSTQQIHPDSSHNATP